MRKIALLATLFPVALSLAVPACGSDDNGSTPDDASTGSETSAGNDSGGIIDFDVAVPENDANPGDDDSSIPTGDDDDDDAATGDDDASGGGGDDGGVDASDGASHDASDGASQVDASDAASQVDANDGASSIDGGSGDDGSSDVDANDGAPPVDAGPVPTVFVVRVGDGTTTLTSASSAVFLDEYPVAAGSSPVRSIPLPTAASGSNNPLCISGTATSEGQLGLSSDGHYVTLAGYAAAPGIAGIATSPSAPPADGGASYARVVARVDSIGAVNTSTLLAGVFSGSNVRSAITTDGTAFWVAGAGTVSGGGVQYVMDGVSDASVRIVSAPANVRNVNILFGQLYLSSGSAPFVGVSMVGSGVPTSASTATLLPGFAPPDAGGSDAAVPAIVSPFAYVAFDLDSTPGIDVLYVADSPNSGGGVQKWTFDGAIWSKGAEATLGTKGVIGLTGFATPAGITLVGTTTENPANLVYVIDTGTSVSAPVVIASSPTKTFFRGVALSPSPI